MALGKKIGHKHNAMIDFTWFSFAVCLYGCLKYFKKCLVIGYMYIKQYFIDLWLEQTDEFSIKEY